MSDDVVELVRYLGLLKQVLNFFNIGWNEGRIQEELKITPYKLAECIGSLDDIGQTFLDVAIVLGRKIIELEGKVDKLMIKQEEDDCR